MQKKTWIAVLIVMLVGLSLVSAMASNEVTEWRLASSVAQNRPEFEMTQTWADKVAELTGGSLKITPYPEGSLGFKVADFLRVLKKGNIEAAMIYDGYYHRDAPDLAALTIQGIWKDPDDYAKTARLVFKTKDEIMREWGIVNVAHYKNFLAKWLHIYSKEPVESLAEMKDKKIRVWSKNQVDTLTNLGISAQMIPQSDLYLALKTGVVDGAVYASAAAKALSLYEVCKYASRFTVFCDPLSSIGVSKKAWDKLTEAQQKAVHDAGEWMWQETVNKYNEDKISVASNEFLKEKGMTFLKPFSEADRATLQKAAFGVWEELCQKAGDKAYANYKAIRAALEK